IHPVATVGIGRWIAPLAVVAVPRSVEPEGIVEAPVVSGDEDYVRSHRADANDAAGAGLGGGWRRSRQEEDTGQERSRPDDGLVCAHWMNPQSADLALRISAMAMPERPLLWGQGPMCLNPADLRLPS